MTPCGKTDRQDSRVSSASAGLRYESPGIALGVGYCRPAAAMPDAKRRSDTTGQDLVLMGVQPPAVRKLVLTFVRR